MSLLSFKNEVHDEMCKGEFLIAACAKAGVGMITCLKWQGLACSLGANETKSNVNEKQLI